MQDGGNSTETRSASIRHRMPLAAIVVAMVWLTHGTVVRAEERLQSGDQYYAVIVETNAHESQTVKPVKLVKVIKLGERSFLVVEVASPQPVVGYIDLEHIRAILPTQGFFSVDAPSPSEKSVLR